MVSGQAFWVGKDELAMSSRFPSWVLAGSRSTPGRDLISLAQRMSQGKSRNGNEWFRACRVRSGSTATVLAVPVRMGAGLVE
jgi:hypothetical protein